MVSFELPFRNNFFHHSLIIYMHFNVHYLRCTAEAFRPIIHSLNASSSSREATIKPGKHQGDCPCIKMNLSVVRCSSLNF